MKRFQMLNAGSLPFTEKPVRAKHLTDECDGELKIFCPMDSYRGVASFYGVLVIPSVYRYRIYSMNDFSNSFSFKVVDLFF